jgi:hypothetical protein
MSGHNWLGLADMIPTFIGLQVILYFPYDKISGTSLDGKELGITAWFSEHYSSYRDSIMSFFRTKKCPLCMFKSTMAAT